MMRPVIVSAAADAELAQAYTWYQEQRPGLGDEFLRCVYACLASIERYPELHPVAHQTVRRALVRRFPYAVFYVIGERTISAIAILHCSRDPKRWFGPSE